VAEKKFLFLFRAALSLRLSRICLVHQLFFLPLKKGAEDPRDFVLLSKFPPDRAVAKAPTRLSSFPRLIHSMVVFISQEDDVSFFFPVKPLLGCSPPMVPPNLRWTPLQRSPKRRTPNPFHLPSVFHRLQFEFFHRILCLDRTPLSDRITFSPAAPNPSSRSRASQSFFTVQVSHVLSS